MGPFQDRAPHGWISPPGADRSRRQALYTVSVIGTLPRQMRGADRSGKARDVVNSSRVALKRHVDFEPVIEDPGNDRPLGINKRLPFL